MKEINTIKTREINAGARVYRCPWGDYRSTSYWAVYGHAVAHAYRKGYFDFAIRLILKGLTG